MKYGAVRKFSREILQEFLRSKVTSSRILGGRIDNQRVQSSFGILVGTTDIHRSQQVRCPVISLQYKKDFHCIFDVLNNDERRK